MAIEGDLRDMSLDTLIQMVCQQGSQRMGLFLRQGHQRGIVYIERGEVVHACLGTLEGEQAVYQLLRWTAGTFRTSAQVEIPRQTIRVPWGHLLLEGARQADELGQASPERHNQPLSPQALLQDNALENDLTTLISQLEFQRSQLTGLPQDSRRAQASLLVLAEMVNNLVVLGEKRLRASGQAASLAQALAQAAETHPRLRLLQAERNRLSAQTIGNLYTSWRSDLSGRQETFQQIAHGMVEVMELFFSNLSERFQARASGEQWQEMCAIFLADLAQAVESIKY
jgi:hypothetical protein